MRNAHDVLRERHEQLRPHIPPHLQGALDELEILTRPYMTPVQGEEWIKFNLTPQEARVACLLHTKLGKLVTRDGLMDAMWFDDPEGGKAPKTLDVVLCRVRQKTAGTYSVETIYGRGFIMHRVGEQPVAMAA